MRITVLEWICGGGLNDCSLASVPPGLSREGWAMLDCLLEQFSCAGHQVVTVLDRRLVEAMRARVASGNPGFQDVERIATWHGIRVGPGCVA